MRRPGLLSGTMKSKRARLGAYSRYAGLGAYPVINDSCCQRNDPRCSRETTHQTMMKGKLGSGPGGLRNKLESINWGSMSPETESAGNKAMATLVSVENKIAAHAQVLNQGGYCLFSWLEDTSGTWHGKSLPRGKAPLFTEIDDVVKEGKAAMVKANNEKAEQAAAAAAAAEAEAAAAQGGGIPSSGGPGPSDEWSDEALKAQALEARAYALTHPKPSKKPLIIGALVILLGGVGLILFLRR